MKNTISLILLAGILLLVNLLSRQFFFRLDLTENKQYSLSQSTLDVLDGIEDPVLVKAYFTEGVEALDKIREDFRELLTEYSIRSKGMVDFEFTNPNESTELEQQVQQDGIRPLMINVRKSDQATQQRAYLGAVLESGDQKELIPVLSGGAGMEYELTTSIKKITVLDKPSVGFITGYGTPGQEQLAQATQQLSILYTVENVDLGKEAPDPARYRALALLSPADSIPPAHLENLSAYLDGGGGLFVGINAVSGDLQQQQGNASPTGIEGWLAQRGLQVESAFVVDQNCGNITVQQQQGFFRMNTQIPFYYFVKVNDFAEHPITKGLEEAVFPFMSPITFNGDASSTYEPILFSSNASGRVQPPMQMKINQEQWSPSDFPEGEIQLGGILTNSNGGRIVAIGDGDFPLSAGQQSDNLSLLINCIDWLADDTGLIDLRTKAVASRPLETLEDGQRNWYKMLNFFMPLLLVIGYGIFRFTRRKAIRNKRMQENYAD